MRAAATLAIVLAIGCGDSAAPQVEPDAGRRVIAIEGAAGGNDLVLLAERDSGAEPEPQVDAGQEQEPAPAPAPVLVDAAEPQAPDAGQDAGQDAAVALADTCEPCGSDDACLGTQICSFANYDESEPHCFPLPPDPTTINGACELDLVYESRAGRDFCGVNGITCAEWSLTH